VRCGKSCPLSDKCTALIRLPHIMLFVLHFALIKTCAIASIAFSIFLPFLAGYDTVLVLYSVSLPRFRAP